MEFHFQIKFHFLVHSSSLLFLETPIFLVETYTYRSYFLYTCSETIIECERMCTIKADQGWIFWISVLD